MTDLNTPRTHELADMSITVAQRDRILAAIDIGTNSIHMVVVRIEPNLPEFTIIDKVKDTVRLGNRDRKTGLLTIEAMERSIAALKRCKEIAKSRRAEQIVAVATSAVREAKNGRSFLQRIEEEVGIWVNLISGQEEARRIYLGVLSGMNFDSQPHAIVDIGGGSTELILGSGQEPTFLSSTKVGAVRLTSELVTTDPISNEEFRYLQAYVRGKIERSVEELQAQLNLGERLTLIGTSGTIETLAMIHAREHLGTAPNPLHGYQFSLNDLKNMVHRLRKLDESERADLPGMSERRSEIILAGAIILQEAMDLLSVDAIAVCERALREGVIVDWMLTHGLIDDRLRYQSQVQRRSAIKIAQKYGVNLTHSERVADFALSIFDQTQGKLHKWDDRARELLWAGAILHNSGHYVAHSAHHKHSYYLIRHGELLGYTEDDVEAIANLARYHRKSAPKKKHENYRNLASKEDRKLVEQLSAILRLAVALDRRQIGAIHQVHCHYHSRSQTLDLELVPTDPKDDCALELWSLDFKKWAFEEEFDTKVCATLKLATVASTP